ncbi:MAG: AraC family transcriptional regulator [Pseudomonadota bacterium]
MTASAPHEANQRHLAQIESVAQVTTSFNGRNLRVAHLQHPPLEGLEVGPSIDHVIVFSLVQPAAINRLYDGEVSGVNEIPRTTSILPAGRKTTWECPADTEVLHLYLDDAVLRRYAEENSKLDPAALDVHDTMGAADEFMGRLAPILLQHISKPTETTRLMVDGFEQLLAAHLIGQYSNANRPLTQQGALDPGSLSRVMEYMRSHLDADISLQDLAAQSTLSSFAFARAFKAATGTSPHQMLLAERVARAAQLLRTTKTPLAEIAYAVGFSSQSHMTTTFARQMGLTPGRYRNESRS